MKFCCNLARFLFVCCFLSYSGKVFGAQTASQKLLEQSDTFINQQIYLENQKENFNLQNDLKEPKKSYEVQKESVQNDRNETKCIQIHTINIQGVTLIENQVLDILKKPYLNNCNGITNLKNLVNKITNLYIEQGYVTSRAYLKQQNLADGAVDIDVLESKIEKIIFVGTDPLGFINTDESIILNLRDLEIDLEQHDRLRSVDYKIELQPGTKPGYSIVQISANNSGNIFYGGINFDNLGSKTTGKQQIGINASYENLFNLSDIIAINIGATNQAFELHNYSKNTGLSYSVPASRALLSFNYSHSNFNILSKDEFARDVITFGYSDTFSLKLNYKLYHDMKHAIELNTALSTKQNTNKLTVLVEDENLNLNANTTQLAQQSYILTQAKAGLQYKYEEGTFSSSLEFDVVHGIADQSRVDESAPQNAGFVKYELAASATKRFAMQYEPVYDVSLSGQFVNRNVFAADELSIGGPYSVRGFGTAGISGEKGLYIRNTLTMQVAMQDIRLSPYCGADYGYIAHFRNFTQRAAIAGYGVGLKTTYKSIFSDIFYHGVLLDDESIRGLNKGFYGFSLNYNF